jgi:PAS domain S-box-containing protein
VKGQRENLTPETYFIGVILKKRYTLLEILREFSAMDANSFREQILTLPNILTSLRLVIAPLLLYVAAVGEHTLFVTLLGFSLVLGFTDGLIARKLNQVTELGGKLDSWGDLITILAVALCAWWLWPEMIRQEAPLVIAVLLSYIVPVILGFLKYGRITTYHTWTTKLSLVLIGIGILVAFAGGPLWLFELSVPVLVFAGIEEIAITSILPRWQSNVPTLWHAITIERQRAKEEVMETEEKLRTVLTNIEDGYFEVDLSGNFTFFNPILCKYLGYSEQELLGMNNRQIMTEETARDVYRVFHRVYLTGKPAQAFDWDIIKKDGERRFFETSVSLLRDSEGEPIGFRGIARDTTERKKSEEQLYHASRMVALGTLVSGVAHEINNPNSFIMLNTPLLREAWETALPILEEYYKENGDFVLAGMNYTEMREKIPLLFSGISDGSKRIKQIVDDLKNFVRKDVPDVSQAVDINEVLKSALALASNMIYKSTKNFSVRYGKNIPPIKGNFQRLEQVVINLIQNACQALPDNGRSIRVSTLSDTEAGTVVLRISDQGRGIPAESLPHITDPFFTTKHDSGGVGLGLSISERIVEEHGGQITFASWVGKGTQVEVTLPVDDNS